MLVLVPKIPVLVICNNYLRGSELFLPLSARLSVSGIAQKVDDEF